MDSKKGFTAARLTDDLVVEILSWLPFKSFCRFKCVCKAWLAFSSHPHYCQKLPKIPTGLLYHGRNNSAIQLVSPSPNDEEIDGALTFLPNYVHLDLMDCCSGLVLCKYRSSYTSPDICRFIVYNPATRAWRTLPDTHPGPDGCYYTAILAFNPSWSPQFCVFNFQEKLFNNMGLGVSKLEVFSSDLSTWLLDDEWNSEITVSGKPHLFIDGALYVHTAGNEILVLEGLWAMSSGIPVLYHGTIDLPQDCFVANFTRGCFGQSSGALHYALAEEDGCTILVWNFDVSEPYEWTVKYRLSMRDAFGRDDFVRYGEGWLWTCDYHVVALDLEREVLFLLDNIDKPKKLCSYNI